MDAGYHPPKFPIETWQAIFQYLTRPGDLYNVSITSKYMHNVVQPILYKQLFIDPNYYAIYTLALLEDNPLLCRRVSELVLLQAHWRSVPYPVRQQGEVVYKTLGLPIAPWPFDSHLKDLHWCPLGIGSNSPMSFELPTARPVYHFFPKFTSLQCLRIVGDCITADFLRWVSQLPRLTTLEIRDSAISIDLSPLDVPVTLPLRELILLGCGSKVFATENDIPIILSDALIGCSPSLTSLTMDTLLERSAWNLLADLERTPPIRTFICAGISQQDPDAIMLRKVFRALPTIETLKMARMPRELTPLLPQDALPNLRSIAGQIKSIGIFFSANRPLRCLTITDIPGSSGAMSWEVQLIQFFEIIHANNAVLRSLAFNLREWSEEVFLCICQLWPRLKELKIQCTIGPGVDQV